MKVRMQMTIDGWTLSNDYRDHPFIFITRGPDAIRVIAGNPPNVTDSYRLAARIFDLLTATDCSAVHGALLTHEAPGT